ncbi:MAG: Eco57I restriction-modification methylase domain-containing protein, partial [Dysgonamonadaceae bacterium]|nr:Eco57I restriction-modification methylase domain-containing protein [Dysgonamonadaceae bacterium]
MLNTHTALSLDAKTVLGDNFKDRAPFQNVAETYFAGLVDDRVFRSNLFDENIDAEEALNNTSRGDGFMIFALHLDKKPNRTEISELTRAFNQRSKKMPVLLVLSYFLPSPVGEGLGVRCISLALPERLLYKQSWRQGEKVGKTIILRDIDTENTHAGHLRILQDLANHNAHNFKELHEAWLQALDVNILNKRFYAELSNWYFWAMQHVSFPDDKEKDAEIRNSTNLIRLITRIIFIWFIKEKGLVPERLFDKTAMRSVIAGFDPQSPDAHDYYNAILQNLFFGTLNQKMDERKFAGNTGRNGLQVGEYGVKNVYRCANLFKISEEEAMKLFADVPFLNGGLFDCLDRENEEGRVEYVDGFSRNPKKQAIVPDFLFFGNEQNVDLNSIYDTKDKSYKAKGLINLLNSYKFTIAENTPLEEDVALDPELLGKVFENLLASYNPETRTSARKQTGSFYTPREIVDYMVDESLKAFLLSRHCGLDPQSPDYDNYKTLVEYLFSTQKLDNQENHNKIAVQTIIQKIQTLKILDPACGSGAFPMGILLRMVDILQKLDPKNELWKQRQIDLANKIEDTETREQAIQNIEEAFANNELDYGRKLFLIENCIYGVDIQPIAIQISKLRFFLSLVIEQKADSAKENLGIRPLPNLETKFVAANTLIGLEKPKMETGNVFTNDITLEINNLKRKLQDIRHKYFSANNRTRKLKLRQHDKDLRSQIAILVEKIGHSQSNAFKIASFDLFDQNTHAEWFDPEWMFGITDGFDVVIGNPPYVQLQNNGGALAKQFENCGYKTFARTGDIYCLFYERGWQLLKPQGHLCFITSNKWMRAGYGENTRRFFAENTNPRLLIDFAGVKVFDSATVDVNILMFQKDKNRQETSACIVKKSGIKDLGVFVRQNAACCSFGTDSWVVLSPIEQGIKAKIEVVGTPLKNWDINIYRGILTGYNDAFIIDGAKKAELIAADPKSAEIIRPILRG